MFGEFAVGSAVALGDFLEGVEGIGVEELDSGDSDSESLLVWFVELGDAVEEGGAIDFVAAGGEDVIGEDEDVVWFEAEGGFNGGDGVGVAMWGGEVVEPVKGVLSRFHSTDDHFGDVGGDKEFTVVAVEDHLERRIAKSSDVGLELLYDVSKMLDLGT